MEKERELRVMIAEDEPIILRYLTKQVNEISGGFTVQASVESGFGALEKMHIETPHILLTDIEMPGMNGLELIAKAKEICPFLQIVIISGYSNFNYAQTALRFGVFDYLLKPIETETLRQTLCRIRKNIEGKKQIDSIVFNHKKQAKDDLIKNKDPAIIVAEVKAYITIYFNKPLTMSLLAEQFNYTPSYIHRLFKKKYGCAPIQYQMQLRVEKAKDLLTINPKAGIKDIATAVGYDDAHYFSRLFRQITGTSPSDFTSDAGVPNPTKGL